MGVEASSAPRTYRDLFWGLLGAVVGFTGNWALHSFDATTKRSDAIIQKRMEVYDKISPSINSVYSYIKQVGRYKDITPVGIIETKRNVDSTVYENIPYLSAEFFSKYNKFMNIAFCTYGKIGEDAKIRSQPDDYKKSTVYIGEEWEENWNGRFSGEIVREDIAKSFDDLLSTLANEISISFPINTGGAEAKSVKIEPCPA